MRADSTCSITCPQCQEEFALAIDEARQTPIVPCPFCGWESNIRAFEYLCDSLERNAWHGFVRIDVNLSAR